METNNIFANSALWIVVSSLLSIVAAVLVWFLKTARDQLTIARTDTERLNQEKAVLETRLAGRDDELNRERAGSERRIAELATERNEARKQADDARTERGSFETEVASLKTRLQEITTLTTERDNARTQLEALRRQHSTLETELATITTRTAEEHKAAEDKIRLLEQAEQRLTTGFENLANRIFEEKHQKFSEVSKTSVEALLNPMREQLGEFRKKVDDVYDKESRDRVSLHHEITNLKVLNERIGVEALNLTRALKGDSKVRGNWGEIQLERLLEQSGLTKGREYEVQASLKNEEGQRFRPDVVVHLPDKKDVVIDSKVSLLAYDQYHAVETEEERLQHIRAHIASLRNHINGLSGKSYDELIGVNSLDLVIMFVPIEPALLLALEHEPNLYNEAFGKGILLVSPSTLMGTLKIINNIWRYEYQNRNAQTIADEAGKLHDQFVAFIEALEDVGDKISKAHASYEDAHKRLSSGRGNLVGRTQKLKALGAKARKSISQPLLDQAEDGDSTASADAAPAPLLVEESDGS
jgi:DNA recombination protein RmuC